MSKSMSSRWRVFSRALPDIRLRAGFGGQVHSTSSLRADKGPESIAKEIRRWLERASGGMLHLRKVGPCENGDVASFHGELRDELLNREWFPSLSEARCTGGVCGEVERRIRRGVPARPAVWLRPSQQGC